ncbi:DEKNAAC105217 [Brettanomyces naardenensis]|uniref:Large ribosomal subunit protein uL4m n=1 Tax=Brettanomyces naardenensis TaxID=13370 RepID=A0A448YSL8_BRENA|nr:DEKNAAC105217 [Brettanomyces naardenensis]
MLGQLSRLALPSRFGVRGLAAVATGTSGVLPNIQEPAKYTLATLRSFPSLEPHGLIPVHTKFLGVPLRRDILWSAVVMELDNRRVGASNPPGRSEHKFSGKKMLPQKGSGRARAGDANSPIRHRGAYALARTAPNDFSTTLPKKEYHLAFRIALSSVYRQGNLFIIGSDKADSGDLSKGDSYGLEICTDDSHAIGQFVKHHKLDNKLNGLFIPNDYLGTANLREAILRYPSKRLRVMDKQDVEVRDILKAHRVYIEREAFEYFVARYTKYVNL